MNPPPANRNVVVRWVALGFLLAGALLFSSIYLYDKSQQPKPRHIEAYTPWSEDTLKIAESIPVQDGGRIKPLSTYAGFALYQIHGDRSMKIDVPDTSPNAKADKDGKAPHKVITLKPTAWLLDCLFRPEIAVDLPMFRIDNSAVVKALGLETGAKRDRYSFRDLQAGRAKLDELAKTYEVIEAPKREPEQQQTIDLATNVKKLEGLLSYFAFTRGVQMDNPNGPKAAAMSVVMAAAPAVRQALNDAQAQHKEIPEHVKALLEQVIDMANYSKNTLLLFPPDKADDREWTGVGNEIMTVMTQQSADPKRAIDRVQKLENIAVSARAGDAEFRDHLAKFRDLTAGLAKARGEYRAIALEASYYRADWFLYAMVYFLLGTLLAFGMWAAGWNVTGRIFAWATGIVTATGAVYCVIAITQRCIIMERPPIGNLYDTTICIAAAIVILSLLVELLTRKRFALGLAPVIGTALIVLSRLYEVGDAKDHMDPLVAVLRSNYWLTIHVITITMGYCAGLLTALLSHIYVFMRGTGLDYGDRTLRRTLTRAAYGCVCFTLFLSLVGTVLGGVWANDSWGRFWGWDPKENGALLIVLWNLAILHARLGGYLKEWAFHLACMFGSCVVMFSWWHVNFFNTGLHSYGFTSGRGLIWLWYGVEGLLILLGAIGWAIQNTLEHDRRNGMGKQQPTPAGTLVTE
ncbi:cytochrome c biogenesis protein CcsA [Luteolibacter ambystomatis]|uniref:Cytochrome c biogenesis protein CcsA n=1 Tax=Luteolibacter ambystomatis TaxID=2824561 RepID=A0A975J1T3_9BACT|nr:cytochrome c biogenesis protein CcsA [Luteolibacter ambystomatis]QUE52462.1 cytochrome c biogenesis protein CcsA [Luteolibacter ambystomatis]